MTAGVSAIEPAPSRAGSGAAEATLATRLAKKICAFQPEHMTERALSEARTAIIDTIGCALSGIPEPCVQILLRTPGVADAPGPALLFGTSRRTSALDATLINGTASHALDYDDVSGVMGGHHSAPVTAPIFALGEELKLSGRRALAAYIIGVETEVRLSRAVMSSGWKAQIFWAKRVASVASPAPFRADGVDLITRPSAVMGFLPSELDSCLRLWRIPAGSRCAHEQGADGRHYTLIGTPPPALAIVPSHSQLARMHWSPRHWPRTHWPQDRGARLGPGQGSAVLRHGINDAAPDRVIEGYLAGGMMHRHSVSQACANLAALRPAIRPKVAPDTRPVPAG